jgi:L-fuconate dehydratase
MERNVLEFVDHLHEHFLYPVSINDEGRYNVPEDSKGGYSIEMYGDSMEDFSFPNGSYWVSVEKALKEGKKQPAPGGRSINH